MIPKNTRKPTISFSRRAVVLLATLIGGSCLSASLLAQQVTQPIVAIHDSEYTRALETMPAVPPTPGTNVGASGMQWWTTDWHYFVMPDSAKEALRSDGTAFTVIGDSNITAGLLLSNGAPKYPIIISLSSEAMSDAEIAPLTNYVAAGGFLFISGSAFTRDTNGVSRGDFGMANQMGIHMVAPGLTNWNADSTLTRQFAHPIVSHLPDGQLTWRLPASSEEVNWGISPSHIYTNFHDAWQITASDATVVALGDVHPYLTVKAYGKGYFIYEAAFNPLVSHGGFGPGMYSYVILRKSIEWAFQSANLPVPKLSPWPYQYDAAFMIRHDLEDFANEMADIVQSAGVEYTNGVKGDYYMCTGTVRVDMVGLGYNTNTVIQSFRTAMTNYGATISSHNGGLKNASNNGLVSTNYDYWHWGPDEALDFTPAGYANGTNYAKASVSNSFNDIESWLSGLMKPTMRTWVACNFNATREGSYSLQSQLNIKIIGDQKISPFPHWTLSTQTPDKFYPMLTEPVSEWFVGGALAQSLEPWHPPGVQTSASLHTSIDFYYNLGTLINFYSHTLSTGEGDAGPLTPDYMTYCVNTNIHPRLWNTNGIGIYQWWLSRSNVQVSVNYSTNGLQSSATYSISGATDPNTAIELLTPGGLGFCGLSILTNGVVAGSNTYRILNNQLIRLKVGSSVTNAVIIYYPQTLGALVFSQNFDGVTAPALPAGWTTSASGAESPWVTTTSSKDTAPNSVFVPDAANVGLSSLVSPPIVLPAGSSQLSFRHNYNLEPGPGQSGFDGGVLQIKIGTNAFVDILAAGGTFVSGGYSGSLATNTSSPMAGQVTWCGSSDGYITTIVDLPAAAAGQTNQFQWVVGTDSANAGSYTGWFIDTIAISNLVCQSCAGGTNVPVLPSQSNQTVNEGTLLTVTNAATDPDSPPNVVTYSLVNPPAGMLINQSGVITWTPTPAQGPSTNTITTVAMDCSGLSATNTFKVFVKDVNLPPVLPVIGTQTVNEQTLLTVTNTATEPNTNAVTTGYSLTSPLAGMSISTNGIFTWTPSQTQSPSTNVVTVVVTNNDPLDLVNPQLKATNTFTVIVSEVNTPPVLPVIGTQTVNELTLLTVTDTASEPDIHAVTTGYSLVSPLAGMSISTNGIFTWTPNQSQSPSTNVVTVVATNNNPYDLVNPVLKATNSFTVVVNATMTCQYVAFYQENFDELTAPALPSGWTTSSSGAESNWVTETTVKDSGTTGIFSPDVTAVGSNMLVSPSIATPSGSLLLSFRNNYAFETGAGTDGYDGGVLEIKIGTNAFTDILTASGSFLNGGYASVIDTHFSNPLAGRQAWSGSSGGFITTVASLPSSASSTNIQLRWITGTDSANGSSGWYIDTISISNMVCVPIAGPTLPVQTTRTVNELSLLTVTNTATESNSPPLILTYQLISPPAGASISTNGIITWTPSQSQSPSTNTITTVVTDNSSPTNYSATNTFTVIVNEVNVAPTLPVIGTQTANELTLLTVTNTASEPNSHAVTTGYSLVSPLPGMSISTNGIFTWTPSQSQSPSTNVVTVVVTNNDPFDLVNPVLKATNSFTVVVNQTMTCQYVAFYSENFDEVTAPALPSGWTTSSSGAESSWVSETTLKDSGSNGVFSPDVTAVGSNMLVSPSIAMPSGSLLLSFRNNYAFETGAGTDGYDGGVLEIKIGTNAFTDILTAGGSFLNGGYTSVIDTHYSNPLTGRQAWSGSSGGWITTVASLPSSASSTNIQLRWITGTDSANGSNGWYIDTISISNMVCTPIGPVLPVQSNQTINELNLLTVTNTATETGAPPLILTYQLISPPTGASISTNGIITWTPSPSQSPSTNTITTVVTDNSSPTNFSATNSFQVVVKEVNVAPTLPVIGTQTVNELTLLMVTSTASEPNIHAVTTGYGLVSPLAGMSISTNGIFTWTPAQNQSPGTNTVTIVVTNNDAFDLVNPVLKATNTFTVIVKEVNVAPVPPVIGTQTVNEQTLLTVTNTATEPNIHATTTGYALVNPSAGMSISAGGIFTWTPGQNQSPSTNVVTVVVTNSDAFDLVNPVLTATNTFSVIVKEVNIAPTLPVIGTQTVGEQTLLTVTNTATEPNIHAVTTGYGLVSPLAGMSISTNGIFTWTPSQSQSPSTNTVTVVVTNNDAFDLVNPVLTATNSFTVIVKEVNIAPVPPVIGTQTVNELTLLTVTNTASEPNIHAVTTGYGLVSPLAGMSISAGGIFTWTPSQSQSPGTNVVTVVVTNSDSFDLVNPVLTATNSFTVIVKEVNVAPTLPVIGTQMVNEQTLLTVTNTATEPNIHAATTGYSLVSPLAGMSIDTNGIFTWTPAQTQSPGTNLVTVVATNSDSFDFVNPVLTATNTFTVIVKEINVAPVLPVIPTQNISVLNTLTVTNTATEPNIHAVTTGYGLIGAPSGMSINSSGIITWTPGTNQVGTTNLITTVVTNNDAFDLVHPQLTATNTFKVVVNGIHNGPSLPVQANATINELTTLIVTNTATDNDIPVTGLTYQLLSPPAGASIDANGIISWSPTTAQSPSTNLITTVVTDGTASPLSATNSFTIFVSAPVTPPIILSVGVTNNLATVTWSATVGHTYRLQFKNAGDPGWTEVPVDVVAESSTATTTNACSNPNLQFYRISDCHETIRR